MKFTPRNVTRALRVRTEKENNLVVLRPKKVPHTKQTLIHPANPPPPPPTNKNASSMLPPFGPTRDRWITLIVTDSHSN